MATNYTYTINIPLSTNKPSVDQPNMQINTNSINSIIGVDHLTFGTATGLLSDGFHTTIHQPQGGASRSGQGNTFVGFPTPIVGVQETFAASYTTDSTVPTTDTQLFSMTGLGGISQLTGNFVGTNGWCWCGGILLQWGLFTIATNNDLVTFKASSSGAIPFPNACFNVQLTGNSVTTSSATSGFTANNLSRTAFSLKTVNYNPGSKFFWFAIGN